MEPEKIFLEKLKQKYEVRYYSDFVEEGNITEHSLTIKMNPNGSITYFYAQTFNGDTIQFDALSFTQETIFPYVAEKHQLTALDMLKHVTKI